MRKFLLASILALAAVAAFSQNQKFVLDMGDFAELKVVDGINVTCIASTDSAGIVAFECPAETAPLILLSNDKNTLKIQLQTNEALPRRLPSLRVYSKYLSKAENSGDSTLYVVNPAPSASIKFNIIGNGRIVAKGLHSTVIEGRNTAGHGKLVLEGRTNWVKLRTLGSGSIEAAGLQAEKASIFMGGTGSVDCWATGEITITGLGSGKVYLKGKPQIKNRTLGTVKVIPIEQ